MFLLFTPAFAMAQDSIVSQNVTVIKDFTPEIKNASKITFRPHAEPPTVIDFSNINYNVLYRSEPYLPYVNPLSMPTYERSSYTALHNGYANIMIGYPLQTRANLFYTTRASRDLILGAGFNHKGFYDKLRNDYGDKTSALDMTNELSLMLQYRLNDLEIKFDGHVQHHIFDRYGYANPMGGKLSQEQYDKAQDGIKQYYLRAYANIFIGMPENSLHSLFNSRFKGSISFISDKYKYSEQVTYAGVTASTRKLNDRHRFFLDLEYMILIANDKLMQTKPVLLPTQQNKFLSTLGTKEILPYSTLFAYPKYTFNYRKLDVEVGAKMTFHVGNKWYDESKHSINPVAKVQVRFLENMLIPYLSLDGAYQYNTYYNLSAQNPFIANGLTAPNSNINTLIFGFKGDVKSKLKYDAFVGYESTDNKVMFVNNMYGNTFAAAIEDLDAFIMGVSFKYNITQNVYVDGVWRYDNYKSITNKELGVTDNFAYGIPKHKAAFKVGYDHNKDIFGAYLKATIQSKRECVSVFDGAPVLSFNEIGAKVDLSLGGYYKYNNRLSFNLELNNVLGSKLYEYNFYRGIGFNALIGASFLF